jgi:hypothetical protein
MPRLRFGAALAAAASVALVGGVALSVIWSGGSSSQTVGPTAATPATPTADAVVMPADMVQPATTPEQAMLDEADRMAEDMGSGFVMALAGMPGVEEPRPATTAPAP